MAACSSSGFLHSVSVGWAGWGSRLGGPLALQRLGPLGSQAVVELSLLCSCSCPGLSTHSCPGSGQDLAPSGSGRPAPPFLHFRAVSLQDEGSVSSPLAPALLSACVSARLWFPL